MFIYTKADPILKVIVVYLFISCFFSKAPYLSFTSYISFIAVAYYYLLCLQLKDFVFVSKIAQAIFFLNIILLVVQQFGKDTLLNFGREIPVTFGTIGNPMWLGSLLACLSPFLFISSRFNAIPLGIALFLAHSVGAMLSLLAGLALLWLPRKRLWLLVPILAVFLFLAKDKINIQYKAGRWPVWKRTIQLINQHPFVGWGPGTYKVIFPVLSKDVAGGIPGPWEYEGTKGNWIAWRQAHNCFLQIAFETGYLGFGLFSAFIGLIIYKLWKLAKTKSREIALSGMAIIFVNMMVHYPSRQIQIVLYLIVFLAYCNNLIKEVVR